MLMFALLAKTNSICSIILLHYKHVMRHIKSKGHEKCKTKYLSDIIMLVGFVSYILQDTWILIAV